ncbi:MAG: hypothetical protein PWP24_745 [Clostridiales bacterium]|nr:hypothetical protein [Clostridiales bacterium]
MSEMIAAEVHFYLASFVWGMTFAAIYDILRIARRLFPHRGILVAFEDLIFWVGSAVLVFRMIYRYNDGKIRIPGMLVLFLGMLLYHFAIGKPIVEGINRYLFLPIKKIMRKFRKLLKNQGKKVKILLKQNVSRDKPKKQ